jgi:hypothetical protein
LVAEWLRQGHEYAKGKTCDKIVSYWELNEEDAKSQGKEGISEVMAGSHSIYWPLEQGNGSILCQDGDIKT